MNTFVPLGTVSRDGVIESTHLGDLVVADQTGKIVAGMGDPNRLAYYRSSSKPLQALTVVQSGAADKFALTDTELAICCASHHGCRIHVLTVRGILEKLGLDETALACGVHDPVDTEEHHRLIREGLRPSPLHNNCSGKHAGMLASALALEAPVAGYLALTHPVQQSIMRNLELATGVPQEQFRIGTDGCGAPTVAVPLQAMATSFARLANPENMAGDFQVAARRLAAAMAIAPEMISSPGAFNSELLAAGEGRLVAKGGAEGLFCVGISDPRGLGLAVKEADGSGRALAPVVLHLLKALGAVSAAGLEQLASFVEPEVRNCHGAVVGSVEVVFDIAL